MIELKYNHETSECHIVYEGYALDVISELTTITDDAIERIAKSINSPKHVILNAFIDGLKFISPLN